MPDAQSVFSPEEREILRGLGAADIVLGQNRSMRFANGLYRTMDRQTARTISTYVAMAWPEFDTALAAFAHDWMGRVFCEHRLIGTVYLAEPGTAEVLEIGLPVLEFHGVEIAKEHDAALASSFYVAWLNSGGAVPTAQQCIGYRKPLFLGGADEIENLELCDLEVYWSLLSQTIARLR